MSDFDPMASARELYMKQMKWHRANGKLTQAHVGDVVGYSPKTIGAFERNDRPPNLKLSRELDKLYRLDGLFEALYLRMIDEEGLPHGGFPDYLDEESRAGLISMYYQYMIPGLLQTEAYAREVLRAGKPASLLDDQVTRRLERQAILTKVGGPSLVVLLEEGVIRSIVGSVAIMKEQLQHLLELMQQPHIAIHVVPKDAPVYPEVSFIVLGGFEDEPDKSYEEMLGGRGQLTEDGPQVTEHRVTFDLIRSAALHASDSERLIRDILEQM